MSTPEEIEERLKEDPALKEAMDKAAKAFEEANLSSQITLKLYAAVVLAKQNSATVSDDFVKDVVFAANKAHKLACAIELMQMILDQLMNVEADAANYTGGQMLAQIGAMLENLHNHAARKVSVAGSQMTNIMQEALKDIKLPPMPSESRQA